MSSPSDQEFEVRRQLVQMQMLYEVGLAMSESLDPSFVAEQVLHRALAMVDARAGALLVCDSDETIPACEIGLADALAALSALDEVRKAWDEGQVAHIDRGDGEVPRHVAIVPLRFHEEVGGVLLLADKEMRGGSATGFDDDDDGMLESFAMQAGSALRNARLHQDLQSAFEALKAAQEKIAQLEQLRALGDLAGDLTHSMRHALGLVVGHADMFLDLKSDPEKAMRSVLSTAEGGQDLIGRIDRAAAAATAKVDRRCCAKTYDPSRGVGVSTRLRLKETVQFVGEGLRVPLAIR